MTCKIGIDGGGTKTECILVDATGAILARHVAPGCNPNVAGPEQARAIVSTAIATLIAESRIENLSSKISHTCLFMAGLPAFWQEFAATLTGLGRVTAALDSLPTLELATGGAPGLVVHAGTGSFVAARSSDGAIHYAGGTGWRFGDPGSGYELGRRAIARALLELQGWLPPSRLGPAVRDHTQLGTAADARAVTRYYYSHAEPNRIIAALAPVVLRLAEEGDAVAREVAIESAGELLALANRVAEKLFPGVAPATLPTGLSGALLNHPVVAGPLAARTRLALQPITAAPIEGVRRLLLRET
ncbi:MAG: BadF/BadG/BcrA/BcrD ATPase family protein [Opitutaceae bacterium]|nr:BadF/BadG/BcrA/BcrD ATPase family protein [Opitutaceae bacterium]